MSNFTDFIAKTTSEKIVLFELDYGEEQGRWYNDRLGIWAWQYYTRKYTAPAAVLGTGNHGFDTLGGGGSSGNTGEDVQHTLIGSVKADAATYTEASTLANCITLDSSWYFDKDEQILYFHGVNGTEPESHLVIVGITKGMSNTAIDINTMFYEPRITSEVAIEKTLDSLEWGIMQFDGATLTLSNNDGYFDNMFDNYIFGQQAVIKFGGNADRADPMAYSDYQTMFIGQVGRVILGENSVDLELVEKRSGLSKMVPPNAYDQTTYPSLADEDVGKAIPLVYGTCYNVPCICTNEDEAGPPALYVFQVADMADHSSGIAAITTTYIDGIATAPSSTHPTTATFKYGNAKYTAGQSVTADVVGFKNGTTIENSIDIIKDIMNTYGGIADNSTNYNSTVVDSVTTYDIGLFIDDKNPIHETVEKIAYSNMANFIVDDDGRYSWHKYDSTEAAAFTVAKEEIIEGEYISPVYDSENYLTSCHVGYHKNWDDQEWAWASDAFYQTASYAKYGKYRELKMETLLVNSVDATELASAVMSYMNEVQPELNNTTGIQYIDKDIGDMCNLNGDRVDSTWMGSVKCEIVGLYKTLGANPKVTLVGREAP